MKIRLLRILHTILWAVWWRVAIRVGKRDEEFPDFAWHNTRPRMQKMGAWFLDWYPYEN